MRLIDADKVLKNMRNRFEMQELYLPIHFQEMVIDEMPTAYNVKKVIKQLEIYLMPIVGRKSKLYQTVLEIVKKGGV